MSTAAFFSRMSNNKQATNSFDIDTSLNDFVKINDKRLAFIYTSFYYIGILIIFYIF